MDSICAELQIPRELSAVMKSIWMLNVSYLNETFSIWLTALQRTFHLYVLYFCEKAKNLVIYCLAGVFSIHRSLANGVWFASNFPRELYDFIPQNPTIYFIWWQTWSALKHNVTLISFQEFIKFVGCFHFILTFPTYL